MTAPMTVRVREDETALESASDFSAVRLKGPTLELLSHRGCPAVPSPKRGLTSVFGKGTGVAPALWRVGKLKRD